MVCNDGRLEARYVSTSDLKIKVPSNLENSNNEVQEVRQGNGRHINVSDQRDLLNLDDNEHLIDRVRFVKKPCFYKGKFYSHGQIIAVDPGQWIIWRGEVYTARPGKMLRCDNGKLKSYEIRLPR